MFQNKNESAVRNNALFKGFSDANLNFNFNQKNFAEVGEGEIIYKSGDPSDYLYLVIEGEIKLKLPGGVSSPLILKKSNGEFFGEKEVLDNSSRKSSAVADKNSLLYTIRKIELTSMAQTSKDLKYNLMGDVREGSETESNKKDTVFDGLIGKLSEQTFFQSDNNNSKEQKAFTEQEVIGDTEEEINNEAELNFKEILPDTSEPKKGTEEICENVPEMMDPLNIESIGNNDEKLNILIEAENKKSDPRSARFQLHSIINAVQKIFSDLNPEEIFVSIPEAISGLLNTERAILYIINTERDEFRTRIKTGTEYSNFSLKMEGSLILESVNRDKIISLNYPSDEQLAIINPIPGEEIKSLLISPIKNKKGKIIGIIELININKEGFDSEDEKLITELSPLIALAIENSAYVEDLLHSDRLISLNKVANFLIHDIKNPIVTIKQYTEHIKKQDINKEVNLVLDMIVEQANCVVDLVQTTLGYSEGKSLSNLQPILLTNALNYILSMLAEYVESRNVKLFKKFEGDGLIGLDKKEFYQACFQIAQNACDAMPQGGNFYILTKREGDKIRIELKDKGIGIPDSIKDKIFEPFMTHGKKQKSGLGLAIAEKIIKEHNGVIWAESDLGEGAVLIIELPVLD